MVTGVDIGTYLTKVIVLKQLRDDIPPSVVAWGTSFTEGMRKGAVVDEVDVARSISRAIEDARYMLDEPIEEVYIGFGGSHISSFAKREKIAVSKADGEVSPDDVLRLKEHVARHTSSRNRELITVLEQRYTLDETGGIPDPVGMHGIRLELEGLLIEGDEAAVKSQYHAVEQANLKVADSHLGVLAAADAVLTKKQRELGVVLVDIGASTTSVVVYEERTVIHLAVIPIGAAHITNDLAIGMKTSIDIAEMVKVKYGYGSPDYIPEGATQRVSLSEFSKDESASFSVKFIAEVIEARIQEIFEFVNGELARVEREELLPAGAVLTGGGANIRNIVTLAKSELNLPADVGYPTDLEGDIADISDPLFATCAGLVKYGMNQEHEHEPLRSSFMSGPVIGSVGSVWKSLKRWLQTLFPE